MKLSELRSILAPVAIHGVFWSHAAGRSKPGSALYVEIQRGQERNNSTFMTPCNKARKHRQEFADVTPT
jgi:hypothetical protein